MRCALIVLFALSGCTLTVGHQPESSRVTREAVRAEYEKLKADDLATALAEVAKIRQLNGAANRVLLRNGYPPVTLAPLPTPTPTPEKK